MSKKNFRKSQFYQIFEILLAFLWSNFESQFYNIINSYSIMGKKVFTNPLMALIKFILISKWYMIPAEKTSQFYISLSYCQILLQLLISLLNQLIRTSVYILHYSNWNHIKRLLSAIYNGVFYLKKISDDTLSLIAY